MWVSLLFLAVWFHKPLVHTAPLSVLNTDTQPNSADVLCRLTKLLFPQTGTPYELQPIFTNDEILWRQQNADRIKGAVIDAVFDMPRVMVKLEDRILQSIAANDARESEFLTKPQISNEAEIYAKLLQNISNEFAHKEEYLVKVQEQETRIKMARDEAIQIASQAFKDNLDKAVLALEEKINAIESKEKPVTKINIPDTRSQNLTPSEYRSKGVGVYHEFKANEVIGLPKTLGYPLIGIRSYAVLKTIVPWGDTTGGYVMQIAYAGNAIRMRIEAVSNPQQWSVWQNTSEIN